MLQASSANLQRQVWIMAKVRRKVSANENRCEKLHGEMNMRVGPTRMEPLKNFPVYIMPDLDPMQKQINRIESEMIYEARCNRRRAWRKDV